MSIDVFPLIKGTELVFNDDINQSFDNVICPQSIKNVIWSNFNF